jgi:hypothetical protein
MSAFPFMSTILSFLVMASMVGITTMLRYWSSSEEPRPPPSSSSKPSSASKVLGLPPPSVANSSIAGVYYWVFSCFMTSSILADCKEAYSSSNVWSSLSVISGAGSGKISLC